MTLLPNEYVYIDKPHEFVQLTEEDKPKENSLGTYHEFKCQKCKLRGKRYSDNSYLTITGKDKIELIENCTGVAKPIIPTVIQITNNMFSHVLVNKGEVYNVVTPPPPHKNDLRGVWIYGRLGYVQILSGHFCAAKRTRTIINGKLIVKRKRTR